MRSLICSERILLSSFALLFLSKFGLKFSLFVGSLYHLGIRVNVASCNELGSGLSVSVLWKSLMSIGISTFLKVW